MSKAVLKGMEWVRSNDNRTVADEIIKNMGKKCPEVLQKVDKKRWK
ncbi:MAG: hypothetical protein HQK92_06945 [Nitrospirae bacterium]|nr:hypothetical protein [Nitrospirota bacterium]